MVNILIVDDHILMRRAVRAVIEQEKDFSVVAEACNGLEAEELALQTQPDIILMDLEMPGCDGFEATERVLACSPQSRVVIFTASHEEQYMFQAIQRGAVGYITKDVEPEALVHAIHCAARNDLCIAGPLAAQMLAHIRSGWHPYSYFSSRRAATYAYRTPLRSNKRQERKGEDQGITGSALDLAHESPSAGETTADPTSENVQEQARPLPIPLVRPLTGREQEILDLMRKGLKNREIAGVLEIAESTVHKHVQNIFEKLRARNRAEAIYLSSPEP